MKIIIFENKNKSLGVINPTQEALLYFSIKQIAFRSTPIGLPFWIIDNSELPTDHADIDTWELDGSQGEPDGYGEA